MGMSAELTVFRDTTPENLSAGVWTERGDRVSARDLFDLSLVIEREPQALRSVAKHLIRHSSDFLEQLQSRSGILRLQFEAIDVLSYKPTYEEAAHRASEFLSDL
jgi:hypothetical protein